MSPSSLGQIFLWFSFKLVQTLSGTEAQLAALMVLRVALPRLYRHPAHRIFGSAFARSISPMIVTAVPMNHVRTASEAHHQVEDPGVKQQRQQTSHNSSFPQLRASLVVHVHVLEYLPEDDLNRLHMVSEPGDRPARPPTAITAKCLGHRKLGRESLTIN
jgi:hypothetical protein